MVPVLFWATLVLLQAGPSLSQSNVPVITDYSALDRRFLSEDLKVDSVVGRILAFDPDGTDVVFEIFGAGSEYFFIDRKNGTVILKKELDSDTGAETEIRMIIQVTDADGQVTQREGKVFIQDANDNPPLFSRYDFFESLSEATQPGHVIAVISVSDVDSTNDILSVRCVGRNADFADACDKFGLSFLPINTSNIFWRGELQLKKPLDYEQRISYAILLEANDGKYNETNEIHIEVEDVNDSPPIWTRTRPVFINEEEPIDTLITTVTANDGDVTNPRDIHYEIMGFSLFQINNETGRISNRIQIDYDDMLKNTGVSFEVNLKAREVISRNPLVLGDDATTTSTTVLTITVNDIDDNAPIFDQPSFTAFIPESIATGANIPGLQMTISDKDSDFFNSFDLQVLDHTDVFDIIPNKGKSRAGATLFIKNGELIDYEPGPREYVIRIQSRENVAVPGPSGSTTVTIKVTDVNDQDPIFSHETYYQSIPETSRFGTVVIDLDATDSEAGNFGTAGMRYKLFGSLRNHFEINEVTGVITVGNCATPGVFPCIDAERKTQSFLTVSATDDLGRGRTRSVQVIVNITDENDNVPKPEKDYTAYIIEGQTEPVSPLIIEAKDPDTVGGPLRYELSGDPNVIGIWQIQTSRDEFGDLIGTITARRPILFSDAENSTTGEVRFKVLSKDVKDSVESNVRIIIIDINNNEPKFSESVYETSIREDTVGQVSIYTVTATDGDAPTTGNGVIDFSVVSGGLGKFTVFSSRIENGKFLAEVFTTPDARFNYDTNKRYEIQLEARDQGTPESRKGSATLIVNILDVNNNVPEITPRSVYIDVPEDRPLNTNVHEIVAIDPDRTADISYFMTATRATNPSGGNVDRNIYQNMFRLEENTGIVRVNSALNREVTSFIVYELTAVDKGANPPQTGTGALFVTITEVNDQDPKFDFPLYNITLDEELNIQYFVRNLHCRDDDDQIASYSIKQVEPRAPEYFSVVDSSGIMTISRRIDYEAIEEIRLTAECVDDGRPSRTGTTSIYVQIRNINDNAPQFLQPLYRGSIEETREGVDIGGTWITTVSATDIDKGDFGIVRYTMGNVSNPFEVNATSGRVTVKPGVSFDREQLSSYGFQVVAYDSPNTPAVRRSTTVPVYVTILDINDNCPIFGKRLYTESIPESAKLGTDILDIMATDKDFGINRLLTYTVQDGSFDPPEGKDYFDIGIKSGRIFTRSTLSKKQGVYKFNITATDTEGKQPSIMCSTSVPIEITVLPSENHAPKWIRPPRSEFVIYVLESQYEGMLVYNSRAEDFDSGPSGVIDYFFVVEDQAVSATKEFRMNQVTGIIRAEIEFDREKVDKYFLTLLARDQGPTKATSQTTLTVVILDVDDNDPVFPMNNGVVTPLIIDINENEGPKSLGNCSATDADSDHKNNKIFYEIFSPDEAIKEMISVDPDTCEISLKKVGDFEMKPKLEFSIYAFNEKNDDTVKRQKRSVNPSILPVVVRFKDVNDSPPKFSEQTYFACASLDSPFQSSILALEASDNDENPGLTFGLDIEGQRFFRVDSLGIIRNAFSLSSTTERVFSFTANVNDGNHTAFASVNVFVTSEENQVKFIVDRPSSDVRRVLEEYRDLVTKSDSSIRYTCINVRNHIDDDGKISNSESDVFFTVLSMNSAGRFEPWSASRLIDHINSQRLSSTQSETYNSMFITGVSKVDDDDDFSLNEDVVLAILIITIILIVLAIILFIVACYCIWHKKKKKTRKVKARRHTIVQNMPNTQEEAFENPAYHNAGYVAYEDEYSTVKKSSPTSSPIAPVIIPAPSDAQPLSTFQPDEPQDLDSTPPEIPHPTYEPEPVIETGLEPEPVIETGLEPEPVIVTEVESDDEREPSFSSPYEPEPHHPDDVIETEVMPEEHTHPDPEPLDDDQIETVIVPDDEPPLPAPPTSDEVETEIRSDTPPPYEHSPNDAMNY